VIGAPSIFKLTRKAAALVRVLPTFTFRVGHLAFFVAGGKKEKPILSSSGLGENRRTFPQLCFLHSVGHRVETHRITPAVGNERGDIKIKDYVILPHGEDDRIPPCTLMMDVTMTHDHYGRTTQQTNGALTQRVSSTGAPQPDGAFNKTIRKKIRHYRQIYADRPDPIVFLSITVSISGRVYEDFTRLHFLHEYRETSILAGELPEESEQFRFLRASHLTNLRLCRFNSNLRLWNVGYCSHRFVYAAFHT
jgi:hypothetical protein